jgi:F-type H+-transporting ATPase subunit a
MSEGLIVAVLLAIIPLVLPIVLQAFALLIGQIQAYIFAILATVYIASAAEAHEREVGAPVT